VRPIVDAEIEYGALTDGLLREAVFKGLRDDLALPAAHAPPVASDRWQRNHKGRGAVPRENILQLLPDAVPPSKEQLAAYWRNVAKRALPYLGRRPLKLVRHTRSTTFYHKGALPPDPGRRASVADREAQRRRRDVGVGRQPCRIARAGGDGCGRSASMGGDRGRHRTSGCAGDGTRSLHDVICAGKAQPANPISTICATAAARRRSAPFPHARRRDFRSPRR